MANKNCKRYKDIFSGRYFYVKPSEGRNTLLVLGSSIFVGFLLYVFGSPSVMAEDMISPYVSRVAVAKQALPTPTPTPIAYVSERHDIEDYIREVFEEDGERAVKIAMCESRFNPETIGDTHIMSYNSGESVGDSIGIFQVRTGGKGWNRARANGMSVDEFRNKLKDYKYNIDYAKTIFDRRGFSAWWNCMNKVL